MTAEDIVDRIKKSFPDAKVKAYDLTGGGDHWQLRVETAEFVGKSMIQQHQMVYGALGEWMKGPIHALKLDTALPRD